MGGGGRVGQGGGAGIPINKIPRTNFEGSGLPLLLSLRLNGGIGVYFIDEVIKVPL